MNIFCSNCGLQLKVIRKALPKLGKVLDLVEPHTCLETPIDPSSIIQEAPIPEEDRDKFVKSLNELKPADKNEKSTKRPFIGVGTDDLHDRRFEQEKPKSTAPMSVIDQLQSMQNSIPSHDLKEEPSNED